MAAHRFPFRRRRRRLSLRRLRQLRLQILNLRHQLASTTPLEPEVTGIEGRTEQEEHERRVHQGHDLSLDDPVLPSDGHGRGCRVYGMYGVCDECVGGSDDGLPSLPPLQRHW